MGELFDTMSYSERFSNFITYLSVYSLLHFVLLPEISKLEKYWPGLDFEVCKLYFFDFMANKFSFSIFLGEERAL